VTRRSFAPNFSLPFMPRRWQALSLFTQTFTGVKNTQTFFYWNIHLQPRLISVGRGLVSILMDLSLSQIYLSDLFFFFFLPYNCSLHLNLKIIKMKRPLPFLHKQGSVLILLLFLFYDLGSFVRCCWDHCSVMVSIFIPLLFSHSFSLTYFFTLFNLTSQF